jgi:phosphosulfolactate synthase (CoM biosynthesis protein A)
MDELEFDKTRKAIKAHELSEEERKKLLQTFVEKGGKVLQEKSIKKNLENQPKLSLQQQKKRIR